MNTTWRRGGEEETGGGVTRLLRQGIIVMLISVSEMKKIFGKIDTSRRDDKESEKAHSSFIGKKYNVGKHTVVVEVSCGKIRGLESRGHKETTKNNYLHLTSDT